jgi:hypothetical protein
MVLLWVVVPLSWLTWLFVLSWRTDPRVSLRQCLGWFVVNVMAFLQRFLFGFLIPKPSVRYVGWHDMDKLVPEPDGPNTSISTPQPDSHRNTRSFLWMLGITAAPLTVVGISLLMTDDDPWLAYMLFAFAAIGVIAVVVGHRRKS